jgi:hypothetical protein
MQWLNQDNTRARSASTTAGGMTTAQRRMLCALAKADDEEQTPILYWRSGAHSSGRRVLTALLSRGYVSRYVTPISWCELTPARRRALPAPGEAR